MLLRQVHSQTPSAAESVDSNVIVGVFDQIFGRSDATVLRGGANEPLYQPNTGSGSFAPPRRTVASLRPKI